MASWVVPHTILRGVVSRGLVVFMHCYPYIVGYRLELCCCHHHPAGCQARDGDPPRPGLSLGGRRSCLLFTPEAGLKLLLC